MSKEQSDTPAVTLEQVEAEIAEHGAASENLTAIRDDLLHREQRAQLEALRAQLEEAVRGKNGAKAKYAKAAQAVAKIDEQRHRELQKQQEARRRLSLAELSSRQVEQQIAQIERDLQS